MRRYYENKPVDLLTIILSRFSRNVFKTIFAFFFLTCLLNNQSYTQYGWTQYQTPINTGLYKIFMTDSLNGWTVGANDTIFYTTNGGTNWIVKVINGYAGYHGIYFLNQNTGWLVGITGFIIKTTNGGANWVQQYFDSTQWFDGVQFVNENYGWVVGMFGKILFTSNGGVNWIYQTSGISSSILSLSMLNQSTGWISSTGGVVLKTTNVGNQWFQQNTNVVQRLYDIQFIDENTGWAAGFYPSGSPIIRTTNGGINWTLQYLDNSDYNAVFFINSQTGWVCGESGEILYTSNSGMNWSLQATGTSNFIYDVFFVTPSLGWAGSDYGKILKTTTGGLVSITLNSGEIQKETELNQNYPNPFNPATEIKFSLPKEEIVTIKVYNLVGKEVITLINHVYKEAGNYSVIFDGSNFASGVYFYRLEAGSFIATKKMVLIK
jgi:photosystem II stability/assembly factor-like uncharacterized protein